MRILVTGGAGYIGSHTMLELLAQGHDALVLDNYSNSSPESLDRVQILTNAQVVRTKGDICNDNDVFEIFKEFRPEAVVHFAGLKAVGESAEWPLRYYEQNVSGTLCLLKAMNEVGCKSIVFSSSATVYGEPVFLPLTEDHPCRPENCYGRTKYFIEEILKDWVYANPENSAICLRYFNPVGAHSSGDIGEDPNDHPNNLMPLVAKVAFGHLKKLSVFGDDYDTRDGTGLRDYIHVVDLAKAHVCAVEYCAKHTGVEMFNIGTGNGATVLEIINTFEKVSGRNIPYKIAPRRHGDVAASIADSSKAERLLDWKARRDLVDMCETVWHWQSKNPNGYQTEN